MSKISILIATPAYQGNLYAEYAKCVCDLRILLLSKNINSEWFTINSESLISRGRNACVAYFLSKKEHTHLLFIDADITFNPNNALYLIEANKDISGLAYPRKGYEWNNIIDSTLKSLDWSLLRNSITNGKSNKDIIDEQLKIVKDSDVFLRSTGYILNYMNSNINISNGWLQASEIGTGFMLIKKQLIEDLVKQKPELKYTNDLYGYDHLHPDMKNNFYLFFDCRCEPCNVMNNGSISLSQRYLSEDYAFCKLVRSIGYDIWLYTNATVHHTGNNTYVGNLLLSLNYKVIDMNNNL